jgi:hypothetical protein
LGAYFNSVTIPTYERWTTADNGQMDWEGSTNVGGISRHHLTIGHSLNNENPMPTHYWAFPFRPRAAFVGYHGTVVFDNNNYVNLPLVPITLNMSDPADRGYGGGIQQGGGDNYDEPGIAGNNGRHANNRISNSHWGDVACPIHLDGHPPSPLRAWAIAPVWWDLDGKYGPANGFVLPFTRGLGVVDDFYLSGAANAADGPASGTVVCKTTTTNYWGLGFADVIAYHSNTLDAARGSSHGGYDTSPWKVTRQNVSTGATIGTVCIRPDAAGSYLQGYATWAAQVGGRYRWQMTDGGSVTIPNPTTYAVFSISMRPQIKGDYILLGVDWGASTISQIAFGHSSSSIPTPADVAANNAYMITTSVASIAAVLADATGKSYFRDATNNVIWLRPTNRSSDGSVALTANIDFSQLGIYDRQNVYIYA